MYEHALGEGSSAKSHWFVLSCIHSPETTKTSLATSSVSLARLVPWFFMQLEVWGGADPNLRRSLEFEVSNLSPARGQVPLGSSGALREETPQDHRQGGSTR